MADQLGALRDKLDEFKATLLPPQVELLDEILELTQRISAGGGSLGFDGSFEPGEAALILAYADSTSAATYMIKGGLLHMIKATHLP
jgi:hypothetical protein